MDTLLLECSLSFCLCEIRATFSPLITQYNSFEKKINSLFLAVYGLKSSEIWFVCTLQKYMLS